MEKPLRILESRGLERISAIRSLRYQVLREPLGMDYESTLFSGDEFEDTIHVLAYHENDLAGCLSLLFTIPQSDTKPSEIQLRGMAVSLAWQRHGVGRALVQHSHHLADRHERSLWCKSRQSAIGFYERNGWYTIGDFFDIPVIGPHIIMRREFVR